MIPLTDWLETLPDDPWKRPSRYGHLVVPRGQEPPPCRVVGRLIPAKGSETPQHRMDGEILRLKSVLRKTAVVIRDEESWLVRIRDVRVVPDLGLVFQHEAGTKWLPASARAKVALKS